ncbi:MAG: 2-oxoglutarate dehydrogenase complex dihydrolipoyllysine-residue succinyltransferase, partial [Gammaproteobacteria bacterium]|nr:2-oxoglutarate dehydrogenase complex dihydrolipoyllysine-residue succinyltransferase [Gammaproteobacteria bacterium]
MDASKIQGSGKDGRLTPQDVKAHLSGASASTSSVALPAGARPEERVPMTRLRKTIAKRLLEVQQNAAILTTFNEVDMYQIQALRKEFKDAFEKAHGSRLGLMSFFVKATVEALKQFPSVNASIDGDDVVYHGYFDIGIAVSSPRGLVVPVLRNADTKSMADIEKEIREFSKRAGDGTLTIEEMQGGTFTITNGGTFGSMLSTPIINPPQSGILGMHNIVDRPMVVNGEIKIRPVMYIALSYDHRIIDGRESVSFLKMIKDLLENPARMVLGV